MTTTKTWRWFLITDTEARPNSDPVMMFDTRTGAEHKRDLRRSLNGPVYAREVPRDAIVAGDVLDLPPLEPFENATEEERNAYADAEFEHAERMVLKYTEVMERRRPGARPVEHTVQVDASLFHAMAYVCDEARRAVPRDPAGYRAVPDAKTMWAPSLAQAINRLEAGKQDLSQPVVVEESRLRALEDVAALVGDPSYIATGKPLDQALVKLAAAGGIPKRSR